MDPFTILQTWPTDDPTVVVDLVLRTEAIEAVQGGEYERWADEPVLRVRHVEDSPPGG